MKLPKLLLPIVTAIEFTDLTALLFLAHALFCAIVFLILGASPYINVTSLGLILLMDAAFFVALRKSTEKNAAHILILAWYVLLFFNVRLAVLLLFPPEALEFPAGLPGDFLTDDNISNGLLFIVSGIIAIILGIFVADSILRRPQAQVAFRGHQFSIWALTAYWAVTYLAAYYVSVHLGVTIFGTPEHWGNRMAWVRIIFDTDVALMWTFVWALTQRYYFNFTKYQKLHISLLILGWLIFSLVIGSRGGPLRILIFLFYTVLAIKPKFKLSITNLAIFITICFLINSVVFAIGTAFRHAKIGGITTSQAMSEYRIKDVEFLSYFSTDEQKNISANRRVFYESKFVRDIALKLRPMVTRLAIIDYPLTVVSGDPVQEVIDYYIKSLHPFKNFANNIVPGEIFDDAMVNTSRVFGMAYAGKSLKDISEGFNSEPFTIWGEAWLLAGYKGVFLLFLAAICIQLGFNRIKNQSSSYSIGMCFVYIMTAVSGIYGMFGIDYWLTFIAHFSMASMIAYAFLLFFSNARYK